jgi:hypothetical protein
VRFLKNLSSVQTFEGKPWEFNRLDLIPPHCIADKDARTKWYTLPTTEFMFYSGFVGLNENGRILDKNGSDEGNPPREMPGFVGDHDTKFTEQEIDAAIARMDIKPNWVERSLSGNWRLIWIFERSITLPSNNFARFLLKHLHEFLPINELSGLDKGYQEPSRYYANGCVWRRIHDIPVGWGRLQGWLLRLSERYDWKGNEPGVSIPFEAIVGRFQELSNKFPRFASWPGEFKDGAQGPSFWVEGSTSPTSAIVRLNGIQSFANHATKGFYGWSELLGAEWVKAFEQNRIGNAVTDIFYDDQKYAIKNENGKWDIESKDGIINRLVVQRGLSREINKKKGQTFSEVESALCYISSSHRVKGMVSFAFMLPKGRVHFNGDEYLNTHTKDAMRPAPEKAVWGPSGQFPWISAFYNRYFATPNQLPFYLSWASLFYAGCYRRTLAPGHTIFTGGPVCAGKTLNSRRILGSLVGGFAEARAYLLREDSFNSEIFDYALLVVDDAAVSADAQTLRAYAAGIKRITANEEDRCNEKYRKAVTGGSNARLSISLNLDAESALALPDMDQSTKDKVMFFRVGAPSESFPQREEFKKILDAELPWFARYLIDWEIPAECRSDRPEDSRFGGLIPYHDPAMVATAAQSSHTSNFAEVLDVWMRRYFTVLHPEADVWRGTLLELNRSILEDPSMQEIMRQFPLNVMKRNMSTLSNGARFKIRVLSDDPIRCIYEIDRSTHYPKERNVLEVSSQSDSRFQK